MKRQKCKSRDPPIVEEINNDKKANVYTLVWISSDGEKRKCDREDKERKNNLTKQISLQKYLKNLKRILNYIREFIEEC